MPCGAIKEEGSTYCETCTCDSKRCFGCDKEVTLSDYEVCRKPHVRKIKANKERVYKCNSCVQN